MGTVVGIPRGLFYYKYYPLWKTFFDETSTELAVSPETCRRIMDGGIETCVGEACLPVKSYFGHVRDLCGKADALFVPRYTSVYKNEYICPKFGGLPDLVRHGMKGLPRIIAPEVNMHDRADGGLKAALETGQALGVGKAQAKHAYESAMKVYRAHRSEQVGKALGAGVLGRSAAGSLAGRKDSANPAGAERRLKILLLGHCYTVGDRYINMDAVRKLAELGADAVSLEYFDGRVLRQSAGTLEKPLFWNFGTEALGCAHLLMKNQNIDGVLHLTCFGCGVDSFVGYMFERRVRSMGIPFATVSLDEHTGEAGLQTRLEAFTDTLRCRRAGA